MPAQPAHTPEPDDPAEILRILSARWHDQFLQEYHAALEAAHEVRQWSNLRGLLHRWWLRALAYSDLTFEGAAQEARQAHPGTLTLLPGWTEER